MSASYSTVGGHHCLLCGKPAPLVMRYTVQPGDPSLHMDSPFPYCSDDCRAAAHTAKVASQIAEAFE